MFKVLFSVLGFALFSNLAVAAQQVFTVAPPSKITMRLINVGTSNESSAPKEVQLDGEFMIDIGTPAEGATAADPKDWDVSASLGKDNTIAPVSAVLTTPAVLSTANGVTVTIDALEISGFGVGITPVAATLAGGPPVSTGVENTNAEFTAAGTIQIGVFTPTTIPSDPTTTSPTDWTIRLSDDGSKLGLASPSGNLATHITATTTGTVSATSAAAGELEVTLDLYGYSSYNGPVNPASSGNNNGGSSGGSNTTNTSSSGGALGWFALSIFAVLGLRRRLTA